MAEPTLPQWRIFVHVARKGSLSAAAVELDRTQSAVSHALSSLERDLGTPLFARHGRGVRLNEAGAALLPHAQRLLAQWTALHEAARQASAVTGVVRIAAFPSLARHLLPGALERLGRQHPALSVDVDDVHLDRLSVIEAVQSGRADLGLTQLLPGTGLTAHALGEDPYELVMPASWSPRAVWSRPYIHLGDRHDLMVPQALARHGVQVHPILSLSSEVAIIALVDRGLGFALLPRLTMPALPAGVVRRSLPWPVLRRYGTVTRAGLLPPAVHAVLAVLRAE